MPGVDTCATPFVVARYVHSGEPMTPKVQVGTILLEERPLIVQVLELESEPYSGNWSVIKGLDGSSLDRKIHTAGWNFEVTGIVAKCFLGVPYATVSGHSRHIQQSCVLDGVPRTADGAKREA
jgi:hypothetical protein